MDTPFKERVKADIFGVFIDPGEFAQQHRVEGRMVNVVLASDQNIPLGGGYAFGVSESSLVLYAVPTDLPERREAGEGLNIDGREYLIDAWNEEMGIAEIKLTQTRGA